MGGSILKMIKELAAEMQAKNDGQSLVYLLGLVGQLTQKEFTVSFDQTGSEAEVAACATAVFVAKIDELLSVAEISAQQVLQEIRNGIGNHDALMKCIAAEPCYLAIYKRFDPQYKTAQNLGASPDLTPRFLEWIAAARSDPGVERKIDELMAQMGGDSFEAFRQHPELVQQIAALLNVNLIKPNATGKAAAADTQAVAVAAPSSPRLYRTALRGGQSENEASAGSRPPRS